MIELTKEQAHGLENTKPLPVLNPLTRELFVLVPLAEYQRLKDEAEYDDSPWTDKERNLLRQQACEMLDRTRSSAASSCRRSVKASSRT